MADPTTGLLRGKRLTINKDGKERCQKCLMPAFQQDEFCVRCGADFYTWDDTRYKSRNPENPDEGGVDNPEKQGSDFPGK